MLLIEQVNPVYGDPMDSCCNGEKEQGGADIKMVIDGKILSEVCSKLMADVKYRCRGCVRRAEALVYLVIDCSDNVKEPVDTFDADLCKRHLCEPTVKWVAATYPCKGNKRK